MYFQMYTQNVHVTGPLGHVSSPCAVKTNKRRLEKEDLSSFLSLWKVFHECGCFCLRDRDQMKGQLSNCPHQKPSGPGFNPLQGLKTSPLTPTPARSKVEKRRLKLLSFLWFQPAEILIFILVLILTLRLLPAPLSLVLPFFGVCSPLSS